MAHQLMGLLFMDIFTKEVQEMRLIYHDDSRERTYEEVYKDCQRGYGIKEPDRVSGFAGFFYRLSDIYAYGRLEKWLENNDEMVGELLHFH